MKNEHWTAAALPARILLAGVFIFSGFQKAAAPPQEFAAVIDAYYILPQAWVLPMATVMPWLELIFGAFLLAGYRTRLSASVLGGLLCSFIGALAYALARGISLPSCGCFGAALHIRPPYALALDAAMLGLAFLSRRQGRALWSLDNWIDAGV